MPSRLINKLVILFSIMITFTLSGCYEPESGCLDLLANNYEVSSDNACKDCCTYPSFRVEMKHQWNDTTFSFGDTLTNDIGSSFVLLDQKFYLSDWYYTLDDGTTFRSRDSILLLLSDNETYVKRDILLVRKNQGSISNHTYRKEGTLKSIKFVQGIPDQFDDITSSIAENYSPLSFNNDLYINNTYQSQWLQLGTGANYTDTIDLYFDEDLAFNLESDINLEKSQDVIIPIYLIYDSLFAEIGFEMSSSTEIRQQIQMNKTNWIK